MLFGAIINLKNGSRTDPFSNILEMSLLLGLPYISTSHYLKCSSLCILRLHTEWGNKTSGEGKKAQHFSFLLTLVFDLIWFILFQSYAAHATSSEYWRIVVKCNAMTLTGLHYSYFKAWCVSYGLWRNAKGLTKHQFLKPWDREQASPARQCSHVLKKQKSSTLNLQTTVCLNQSRSILSYKTL